MQKDIRVLIRDSQKVIKIDKHQGQDSNATFIGYAFTGKYIISKTDEDTIHILDATDEKYSSFKIQIRISIYFKALEYDKYIILYYDIDDTLIIVDPTK